MDMHLRYEVVLVDTAGHVAELVKCGHREYKWGERIAYYRSACLDIWPSGLFSGLLSSHCKPHGRESDREIAITDHVDLLNLASCWGFDTFS